MRYCNNCREPREDNLRFCIKCGAPLVEVQPMQTQQMPQMQPMQTQQMPQMQQPMQQSMQQQRPVQQRPVPKAQQKKKLSTPVLVILIIATGLAAILLFFGSFLLTEYLVFHKSPADLFAKDANEEVIDEDWDEEPDAADEQADTEVIEETEASPVIEEAEPEAPVIEETAEEAEEEAVTWEPLDFDMDAEQSSIDDWVRASRKNRDNYKKYDFGDTYFYVQSGTPVIIGAKEGVSGWKYDREYVGVADYYAELSDGYQTLQSFYYEGARLFRVIDEDGVHNYGCEGWEEYNELGERLKEDRKNLLQQLENERN